MWGSPGSIPPPPKGYTLVEDEEVLPDPWDTLQREGFIATNGFRTAADVDRIRAQGYTPAQDGAHNRGDGVDLDHPKLSHAEQKARLEELFGEWEGARVIDEGHHRHLQLPGWGAAPGTPGTKNFGLAPLPEGFELEQRGSLTGGNFIEDDTAARIATIEQGDWSPEERQRLLADIKGGRSPYSAEKPAEMVRAGEVLLFDDEQPQGPATKLEPADEQTLLKMLREGASVEQLRAFREAKGVFGSDNLDEVVAARDKGAKLTDAVEYKRPEPEKNPDGVVGAAARGFGDPINFLDEAGAVVDTLGGTDGRENVWSSDRSFGDILDSNIDQNRSILEADERDHGGVRFAGQLASSLALPIGNKARTAADIGKFGLVEGGVAGFGAGEGGVVDRLPSTAVGAAAGGTAGYALGRVIEDVAPLISGLRRRPTARGKVEAANIVSDPTPDDIASPLDTTLIAQGKALMQGTQAQREANNLLAAHGAPRTGSLVDVQGRRATVFDAFEEDAEAGITFRFDDGREEKAFFADLNEAGIELKPARTADILDATPPAVADEPFSGGQWADGATLPAPVARAKLPALGLDDASGVARATEEIPALDASPALRPAADRTSRPAPETPEFKAWFDPEQVKSATGNRGTYDPTDARMAYSIADEDPLKGDGSRAAPRTVEDTADVDGFAHQVAEPTEAQAAAGNYKKLHLDLHGLAISIENPKGSTRRGVDPNGQPWESTLPANYGYVKGSQGADGDQVDVYVGDKPESGRAFVIDQYDPKTGRFDETKTVLGVDSEEEALAIYDAGFSDGSGPARRRDVTAMSVGEFRDWVKAEQRAPAATSAPSALAARIEPIAPQRAAGTFDEAKVAARKFLGRAITNEETGLRATVSGRTLNKMTSASAAGKSSSSTDHALAVANADALFAKAARWEHKTDAKGEPTIAAIHRFIAPMTVEGRSVNVKMLVKETTGPNEPNPLYTIETLEVEPASVAKPSAPGRDRNAAPAGSADDVGESRPQFNRGEPGSTPPTGDKLLVGDAGSARIWKETAADLDARLKQVKIADKVRLEIVELLAHPATGLPDPRVAGRYYRDVITVAMESVQNPRFTVNHEAWHFLDEKLIKPTERAAMNKAALADTELMASIKRRYANLSEADQMAEARADLFARRADLQPRGFVRTAFERIEYFLKSVGEALRMHALTADDVMNAVERGDIGRRPDRARLGVERYSIADEPGESGRLEAVVAKAKAAERAYYGEGEVPPVRNQTEDQRLWAAMQRARADVHRLQSGGEGSKSVAGLEAAPGAAEAARYEAAGPLGRARPMGERASAEEMAEAARRISPEDVKPIPANRIESLEEFEAANPGTQKLVPAPNEYDELGTRTIPSRTDLLKTIRRRGPLDLTAWLRTQGGLRDSGGELAHMGLGPARQGLEFPRRESQLGRLVDNENGLPLDEATFRAWEAGFFPDHPPSGERPTIDVLLDALRSENNGAQRFFRPEDMEEVERFRAAQAQRGAVETAAQEGRPLSEDVGQPASLDDLRANEPPATAYEDLLKIGGKVANINLDHIETRHDIRRLLQNVETRFGGFDAARRGKIAQAETAALARETGITPDDLLKRRHGQALNAEEAFAARLWLAKSADEIVTLAKRMGEGPSDAERAAFAKALVRHAAIQEHVTAATAEAGRALAQFKMAARSKDAGARVHQSIIQGLGGQERLEDVAEQILEMQRLGKEPGEINKFAAGAIKPRWADYGNEYYLNSLLSGATTQEVNFFSNLVTQLTQPVEHGIAAGIGAARVAGAKALGVKAEAERISMTEVGARTIGMIKGTREGLAAFVKVMKTGDPTDPMTKVETRRHKVIPGVAGSVIRTPTRLLMASDELFKGVARRSALAGLAIREARATTTREDVKERAAALYANPSDDMLQKSFDYARYVTFQTPLGKFGQGLIKLKEAVPPLVLVTPFIRTPINLFKYSVERTPVAQLALKRVREDYKAGGARRDLAIARATFGAGIGATAMTLAHMGLLTGRGPSDPSERKMLEAQGWQPYSVWINGDWYSYSRVDPFATIIGTAADLADYAGKLSDKERDSAFAEVTASIMAQLESKTWLSGVHDLFEAAFGDQDNKLENYVGRLSGSLVPTLSAHAAKAVDPIARDSKPGDDVEGFARYPASMVNAAKSRIPGLSDDLPARQDVFGRERRSGMGPVETMFSPFYRRTPNDDPIAGEFLAAGLGLGQPRNTFTGDDGEEIKLSPDQHRALMRLSGEYIRDDVAEARADPEWKTLSKAERKKELKKIIRDARADARVDILEAPPLPPGFQLVPQ